MNLTAVVVVSLLLAATGALASGPMALSGTQNVTSQATSFNDTTTGPTKPRGPVESPDWI